MRIIILTTEERHHIYYVNRLMASFPKWSFKTIVEEPACFSGFLFALKTLRKLLGKRNMKGLFSYAPWVKINPYKKSQRQFERDTLPHSSSFTENPVKIANHNTDSLSVIHAFDPELIIVFGSRPLTKTFLSHISCPIINHHGAILPYMRGLDSGVWACCEERFDTLGCTIHYLVEGLDEGEILSRRQLFPSGQIFCRVWQLRALKAKLHADLAIELLRDWDTEKNEAVPNNTEQGSYYSWAPWWKYIIANQKLKQIEKK